MRKKTHINTLIGTSIGKVPKLREKKHLVRALFVCAGFSLIGQNAAFAQTAPHQARRDTPLTATGATDAPKPETGLIDFRPLTLSAPTARPLNFKDIKAAKIQRSNRWNPQTLTQPTRLSSATTHGGSHGASGIEGHRRQIKTLPTDTLSVQKLLSANDIPDVKINNQQQVTGSKDGVINLSSSLRGALFNLPTNDNVNASVFKLDLAGQPCLGTAAECSANNVRRIDFGYAKNITKGKKNGFNLQMTPHGGLRVADNEKSALVGALVRIGDNLREGSDMKSNTWYLFAGADAEAVTYTPNSVRKLTSGDFHLQDRIIIGDAQAGVGYRLGDADLALTYYKRQATAENYSYDEDAAALSITWKR